MKDFRFLDALAAGVWLPTALIPLIVPGDPNPSLPALSLWVVFSILYCTFAGLAVKRMDFLALLLVLALLAIVPMGIWAVAYVPLLVGYLAYVRPEFWPLSTIFCLLLSTLVIYLQPSTVFLALSWTLIIPIFILLSSAIQSNADKNMHLKHQLELSRQRESIARDVHDVLGHSLTIITLKAELAQRKPEQAKSELSDILMLARQALEQARTTVTTLGETTVDEAIHNFHQACSTAGINVDVLGHSHQRLWTWVLRETCTNIIKHSRATHVTVELDEQRIIISDNGQGFTNAEFRGLKGLRERLKDAGGHLEINSTIGQGTTVIARLP